MYLFLDIKKGKEQIKKLNEELYTEILQTYKPTYKPNWLNRETFMPHMTIGCFTSREDLNTAFVNTALIKESFDTIVDENEDSIIEIEMNFSNE